MILLLNQPAQFGRAEKVSVARRWRYIYECRFYQNGRSFASFSISFMRTSLNRFIHDPVLLTRCCRRSNSFLDTSCYLSGQWLSVKLRNLGFIWSSLSLSSSLGILPVFLYSDPSLQNNRHSRPSLRLQTFHAWWCRHYIVYFLGNNNSTLSPDRAKTFYNPSCFTSSIFRFATNVETFDWGDHSCAHERVSDAFFYVLCCYLPLSTSRYCSILTNHNFDCDFSALNTARYIEA